MKKLQSVTAYMGRILISLFFIFSGLDKILNWQDTQLELTGVIYDWQIYSAFSGYLQKFFSYLLDWISPILIILTVVEILGGLLIFFNWKAKIGAFFLIFFLIFTTILFHHFWFLSGIKREIHLIQFWKNFAIIGGLLFVLAFTSKKNDEPALPKTGPI